MPAAWTVKDSKGHVFPDLVGGSRLEIGRKIMPTRYDALRLQVSSSYREVFHRDLGAPRVSDRFGQASIKGPPSEQPRSA